MKRARAVVACVALAFALAFSLAACGGSDETADGEQATAARSGSGGGGSKGVSEEQYARGQYTLTENGAADGQYEDAAPEDLPFPTPPDADVVAAGRSGDRAYGVFMEVPSGREAYEFYRRSLPDAGFEIVRDGNTAQNQNDESTNGEGGENTGRPFAAILVVEGNDLRGMFRFDEERVVIGMSEAAARAAAEAEAEREEFRQALEEEATGREAPAEGEEGR